MILIAFEFFSFLFITEANHSFKKSGAVFGSVFGLALVMCFQTFLRITRESSVMPIWLLSTSQDIHLKEITLYMQLTSLDKELVDFLF